MIVVDVVGKKDRVEEQTQGQPNRKNGLFWKEMSNKKLWG